MYAGAPYAGAPYAGSGTTTAADTSFVGAALFLVAWLEVAETDAAVTLPAANVHRYDVVRVLDGLPDYGLTLIDGGGTAEPPAAEVVGTIDGGDADSIHTGSYDGGAAA